MPLLFFGGAQAWSPHQAKASRGWLLTAAMPITVFGHDDGRAAGGVAADARSLLRTRGHLGRESPLGQITWRPRWKAAVSSRASATAWSPLRVECIGLSMHQRDVLGETPPAAAAAAAAAGLQTRRPGLRVRSQGCPPSTLVGGREAPPVHVPARPAQGETLHRGRHRPTRDPPSLGLFSSVGGLWTCHRLQRPAACLAGDWNVVGPSRKRPLGGEHVRQAILHSFDLEAGQTRNY